MFTVFILYSDCRKDDCLFANSNNEEMCYTTMDTNKDTIVETNKAIIQRYFEAYNNKNKAIFDEIIDANYIDQPRDSKYITKFRRTYRDKRRNRLQTIQY